MPCRQKNICTEDKFFEEEINTAMLQQYNSIIWDWNGTLLNDVELCVSIANELLLNHSNIQLDKEYYQSVFGFPITAYYEKIGIDFSKESFEILTKKFISSYNSQVKNCALHKEANQVLNAFKTRGKDQYILTAAHKKDAIHLLDHFSIIDYFKSIEGLDNHRAESKVDRGVALIEANNIQQKSTVLIGDTIHDFEVAEALGVSCILIANGHQSKERLSNNSNTATIVVENITLLL